MPTQNSQDLELEKYFTDVEVLRDWFDKAIATDTLPKRLLVIHGVGGIGKSSLLRMFRLNCKTAHVPVTLASGDEAKSAVDVLTRWAEDLKADGVSLPTFFKTYEHYRAIQAKVEDETSKAQKKLGDIAGKATSKTAEAAGGAALGAALGSVIPGIGTAAGAALGGVIGGMGAEALVDYLRGFLSKPDIDLLLDPSKKLSDDFLADVNQAASSRRVVLMLDTYEQMTALDDWTRDVAQQLNENILLVIAGRAMVNWGRQWSSWLMHAEVQELKPMPKRVMHELIRKYYATMRGGEPNPKQVNAIIEFSGGLPMVVNTAVQLWVKYGVEDFGAVKGEVVREVVARLREGVPTELYPLLETAAALRYFNKEILRAVSGMGDINTSYDELRRFPFVRSRAEGYALHDRVRDMIEENVRTDDPAKYRAVHERAAAYFEARMVNATGEEAERLGLERLYHLICTDEDKGIRLFRAMNDQVARTGSVSSFSTLINDVNTYPLKRHSSRLWRDYANGRLASLVGSNREAERIFLSVAGDEDIDSYLKSLTLHSMGRVRINLREYDRAVEVLEASIAIDPNGYTAAASMLELGNLFRQRGDYKKSEGVLHQAEDIYDQLDEKYGLACTLRVLSDLYFYEGDWKSAMQTKYSVTEQLNTLPLEFLALRLPTPFETFGMVCLGRIAETELNLRNADENVSRLGWNLSFAKERGYVLGMQEKFGESDGSFSQLLADYRERSNSSEGLQYAIAQGFNGVVLIKRGILNLAEKDLSQSLKYKLKIQDIIGVPELCVWLGQLYEIEAAASVEESEIKLGNAKTIFLEGLAHRSIGRYYFECGALTGLVRVKYAQHDYAAIPPLLAEAEQLAQQYEYNDHLASLRLTQGHIAWEGKTFDGFGDELHRRNLEGLDGALYYYKLALVYALRYNRFLLDEVLSGRPQGTPLRPIIPECLKRGEEGRKMLLALREWWQTGTNDVGTPRPDTISPIPENIALLEAEKIAREREPGDGTRQRWVVEQVEAALGERGQI